METYKIIFIKILGVKWDSIIISVTNSNMQNHWRKHIDMI